MKMLQRLRSKSSRAVARSAAIGLSATLLLANQAFAQATGTSPWENAVDVLQTAFTGSIAKGLALVAIVVGGLTFAFGEGGGKKTFAGFVLGPGMAVLAVKFLALSRQAKCIPIVATQGISSLKTTLPGDTWRTLLQAFRTKIFLALSLHSVGPITARLRWLVVTK